MQKKRIAHYMVAMITKDHQTSMVPYGLKKGIKKIILIRKIKDWQAKKRYASKRIAAGKTVERDVLTEKVFKIL